VTIIVWDGKILAADQAHSTESGVRLSDSPKLFSNHMGAVAACGQSLSKEADLELLERVWKGARTKLEYDEVAFVVLSGGKAFKVQGGCARPLEARSAIGNGYEVALGAMWAGEDAIGACQAAIDLVLGCGGKIDTYPSNTI
jgi:hypothetical protein